MVQRFHYGDIGAMTVLCKPPGRCLPVFAGVRTVLAGRARNPELHLNWLLTESRESREKDYWIYLGNFGVPGSISNNSLWEFCYRSASRNSTSYLRRGMTM